MSLWSDLMVRSVKRVRMHGRAAGLIERARGAHDHLGGDTPEIPAISTPATDRTAAIQRRVAWAMWTCGSYWWTSLIGSQK